MSVPDALLETFQQVAAAMPWYRELLAEAGVQPATVRSAADVLRLCPVLTKANTFGRFPLSRLAARTPLASLAGVLTSSGHGGQFSFGLTTRADAEGGAAAIDAALDAAFAVRTRPTLAINCLPMGVTFASRCMTVATTSVREDMAVGLIEGFGAAFEQILLVADPLFLKRLTDHAQAHRLEWRQHRVHAVVGEEVFGERFRAYMAARLGLHPLQPDGTWLMSSFGVGELGLHLLHETRATADVRRHASRHPAFGRELLGGDPGGDALPVCFAYEPSRIHPEVIAAAADGFGALAISMLDADAPIPLLRYATGDVARIVDGGEVLDVLQRHGLEVPGRLPDRLVLVRGRERDRLPNGVHVGLYKDALYAVPEVADRLSGAVRLVAADRTITMHVQLAAGPHDSQGVASALRDALPLRARPQAIEVWPNARFPFGMTLDYERKFVGYAPELAAGAAAGCSR